MSLSDTLHFDEFRYRDVHQDLPLTTLRAKLKELDESESAHGVGLGYSLLGAVATGGLSLLGTAYTGRQLSVINQKMKILKEIIHQRSNEEEAPASPKPIVSKSGATAWVWGPPRDDHNSLEDVSSDRADAGSLSSRSDGSIASSSPKRMASPEPKQMSTANLSSTQVSSSLAQPIRPSPDAKSVTRTQFFIAPNNTLYIERTRSKETSSTLKGDAVFDEAQYLSQVRYQSPENLRKERDAQHQRSVRFIREMQTSLSPDRRGAVEKELSIIGKKRTILNKLIQEAGQVAIDPRSELSTSSSVKQVHPREEQTLISLLDSSEEIVDVNIGSNSHPHPMNTVISGTVDSTSTETFDDDFVQKRPDPSSDAYY
ncbi:hypothetical protein FRC17_004976, partial [Serendipita sp. 399]